MSTSVPPIDAANVPATIRHGDMRAKQAYTEGLAFEQQLVNQLAQHLTATVEATDPNADPGDPSSSSDASGSSGLLADGGGGPNGGFASLIPKALSDGIMSGGGLGLAYTIAQSLDPALRGKAGNR